MDRKEFKVKANIAVGIFEAMLSVMVIFNIYYLVSGTYTYTQNGNTVTSDYTLLQFILFMIFYVCTMYYFVGCRPYKYVVENKEVICKKRLFKDKHLDLMKAEVITDAVPRLADLVTRPHAIEIYDETKKRHKFFPKDPVGFTDAIAKSNRRIHVTVAAYNDSHRSIKRRERRQESRRRR